MPHTARFHSGIIWGLLFEWCALFHPAVAPGLQEDGPMTERLRSSASLGDGMSRLRGQQQPTTPTRVSADSCLKCDVKPECIDDDVGVFSPETRALIKGLGDSPESLQLKAEILNAEQELEVEIELKREKRMRELEEEIKEEVDAKQAKLASLDAQLSERMFLVSEEQTLLDDLKQKAHEMQCKLDEESRKSMNAMGREPPTHAVFPVPCTRVSDPKSAMKEKLREKLEETQKKNQVVQNEIIFFEILSAAKLQALVTLRNSARSWRRNLQGYSWHTEEELKSTLGWAEAKIEGAVKYCTKRKMTKKCLYDDKAVKYLVMVRDDVEAGDEKLKELEQEMKDWGLFDTDFCLGDVFEDEEDTPGNSDSKPKKRIGDWPSVEGEESVVEYVGAYKKACLSKKALIKNTKDRLERDQSKGHEKDLENLEKSAGCLAQTVLIGFEIPKLSRCLNPAQRLRQAESALPGAGCDRNWSPGPGETCAAPTNGQVD
ncbi:unnamed protein product [Cladocopium goreaui]|uniref:BTB domain-containing protein n=1 Tax=Cladocopium goreaui TaxID=2562237 RepID=A0A9P1FGA2_9DINO|nr:unnamed protein product [Cladocopium goreaui]